MSNTKSRTRLFLNNKRTSNASTKDSFNSLENKNQIVLNKGPWTEKEDQLLKKWVKENGPYNWTKCSEFIKVVVENNVESIGIIVLIQI